MKKNLLYAASLMGVGTTRGEFVGHLIGKTNELTTALYPIPEVKSGKYTFELQALKNNILENGSIKNTPKFLENIFRGAKLGYNGIILFRLSYVDEQSLYLFLLSEDNRMIY